MKNAWQLDPLYFAPQPKLGGGWLCFKDSGSPPPAPDYKGAAEATAASSRYNQVTPYGNLNWSQGPSQYTPNMVTEVNGDMSGGNRTYDAGGSTMPGQWTSTINLDPRVQETLDKQLGLSNQMGDLATNQASQVAAQGPMDLQSVQDVADKSYGAMKSRLDPQWTAKRGSFDAQMSNQGIPVGSEAYHNARREFDQGENDAYQQAILGSQQTMAQTYGLGSDIYNQPLNRLNALRTGAQVNNPQFQQPGGGANLLDAAKGQAQYAQGVYGADVANTNASNSAGAAAVATIAAAMI